MTSTDTTPIKKASQDGLPSGHGENAGRRPLTMRLVFLVQVSYNSTIRSDDRYMIVLPCPRVCLSIAYDCLISCKLLLCGDVEENPGPSVEEMFQSLVSGQQAIREYIASLKERLESTEKAVHGFEKRLNNLECSMVKLKARNCEHEEVNAAVDGVQKLLKVHQEKLVDLENRSRRSNLIIFGVPDEPNETEVKLRDKVVRDIFRDKLGINCTSVARIHRLGKASSGRPVITFMQNYSEKEALLKNARKLKGTGISLQNDYCADTLRRRRLLWSSAQDERERGKKVKLVHDKIRIDDALYFWDDAHNMRKAIPKKKDNSEVRTRHTE